MTKIANIMKTVIGRCGAGVIAPLAVFAGLHGAQAATARASFGVSAFVGGSCSMEAQTVGNLTVHCPQTVGYSVELHGTGVTGSNAIVTVDKSGSSQISGVYGRASADAVVVTLTY